LARFSAALVALTAVLGAAPAVAVPAAPGGSAYIGASGTTLTVDGAPSRFVGFNDYQLASPPGGVCGYVDQPTLEAIMADARAAGASVVRTWFFQSEYDGSWPDHWSAFDRVLGTAAEYGLRVVPVLVNEWQDCEPPSVNKNLGFFQYGYSEPNSYGYPLSFRTYATTVAAHYADDPTVAFWHRQ
jgi:hypothetical protein